MDVAAKCVENLQFERRDIDVGTVRWHRSDEFPGSGAEGEIRQPMSLGQHLEQRGPTTEHAVVDGTRVHGNNRAASAGPVSSIANGPSGGPQRWVR